MLSIQDPNGANGAPEPLPLAPVPSVPARPFIVSPNWQVSSDSDAGGLLEYGRMLWRRKLLLLALRLIGAARGFFAGIFMPKMSRSPSPLEIQGRQGKFLNPEVLDPLAPDIS